MQKIYIYTEDLINQGYSINNIFNIIKNIVINNNIFSEITKAHIFIKLSDIMNLLNNGSTNFIQLLSFICYVKKLLN